jgi:hypothetical protein
VCRILHQRQVSLASWLKSLETQRLPPLCHRNRSTQLPYLKLRRRRALQRPQIRFTLRLPMFSRLK